MKTLEEKNAMLRAELDQIHEIITNNEIAPIRDLETTYSRNASTVRAIAHVLAGVMRTELGDEPRNPTLTGFAKLLSVPALGIQFRRHKSANMTKLIATWRDDVNDHIYEITVQRDGDSPNCGCRATATNDGHAVFQLSTKNRSKCEHFAISAMKRYLKIGHRRTYRTIAKKEWK